MVKPGMRLQFDLLNTCTLHKVWQCFVKLGKYLKGHMVGQGCLAFSSPGF